MESEVHEENYRAVIKGATPMMNRSGKGGIGRACTMEAKGFSFTHRAKVFADGRYGRTARDLRRTGRVSGERPE
jgi:hypothetical protein